MKGDQVANNNNLKWVTERLPKLPDDHLQVLLDHISKEASRRRRMRSAEALARLKVGDQVRFRTPKYGVLAGLITRLNRHSANVESLDGNRSWRVGATLLSKVA
jgi:hypothetical protein